MKKEASSNKRQRNLYFSETQEILMEQEATRLGLTVNDWIKYQVTKGIESLANTYDILSAEEEAAVGRAMDDYKHGRTVTLNTKAEIDEYFENLDRKIAEENE